MNRSPKQPNVTRSSRFPFLRQLQKDDGYVLAMTGLLLVPLMIFTAFAVDVGAWYAQGSRLQRAADAAVLAGVVWMPATDTAIAVADKVLTDNGYGSLTHTYTFDTIINTMKIEISESAKQYFSKIVIPSEKLTRRATGQFNRPIPMGSPLATFGNQLSGYGASPACTDPAATVTGCPAPSSLPQFWSAIQGPYTPHQSGDPFATKCPADSAAHLACEGANINSTYRTSGYTYGIDVPAASIGATITVEIYDAIASGDTTQGGNATGDSVSSKGTSGYDLTDTTFRTQFEMFDSDNSNFTTSIDPTLALTDGSARTTSCTGSGYPTGKTAGRLMVNSTDAVTTYKNRWVKLCTFVAVRSGVFPLVVRTSGFGTPADSGGGYNAYSIRTTSTSSSKPTVYAIRDMSIWSPNANASSGGTVISRFYFANIDIAEKGKVMLLDLFDPGDGSCSSSCTGFTMQFRGPPSGTPASIPNDLGYAWPCTYNSVPSASAGGATLDKSSSTCTIPTKISGSSAGIYNNGWLRVRIPLPATAVGGVPAYACSGTDCWWTVKYNFSTGSPNDRTVWSAGVYGDPLHLTS